jgi:hypothetical protein
MNRIWVRKMRGKIFLPIIFLPVLFPGSGVEIAAIGEPLVLSRPLQG